MKLQIIKSLLFSLLLVPIVIMTTGCSIQGYLKDSENNITEPPPTGGVPIVSLRTSYSGICADGQDGKTYCWGDYNESTPTLTENYFPKSALLGKTVKQVSATSPYFQCVVASDDLAYCWGEGSPAGLYGSHLGNGTTTGSYVPVPVDTSGVLSGKTIKKIAIGNYHACVIASDDKPYCWGYNSNGQLGNGNTTNTLLPVAVDMTGALSGLTVKDIVANANTVCVIASDDLIYCWGENQFGQLGNNSTVDSHVPVALSTTGPIGGKTIKSISLGTSHGCAIGSDDLVYCWGENSAGQLGNGTTVNSLLAVAVDTTGVLSGKTVKALAAGWNFSDGHNCVIASDDLAYCWGAANQGQLGNNSFSVESSPVAVDASGVLSGKTIKKIIGGRNFSCAIANDDLMYCWGGESGIVFTATASAVNTSGALSGKTFKNGSGSMGVYCVLASDDQVYCWGSKISAQNTAGSFVTSTMQTEMPMAMYGFNAANPVIVSTAYSNDFTRRCAITVTNDVFCGTPAAGYALSVPSAQFGSSILQKLSISSNHACAISDDNKIYCWGSNDWGQLGNASNTYSAAPVQVDTTGVLSGKTIEEIYSTFRISCAIDSAGAAYCWGYNGDGQLGDGTTNTTNVPVAVDISGALAGKSLRSMSISAVHSCAVDTAGAVYCWGHGSRGQVGDGTINQASSPVAVDTTGVLNGLVIQSVAVSEDSSCVIATNKRAYCWGENNFGQLGDGTTTNSLVPIAVTASGVVGKDLTQIVTGFAHTCALATNGQAYCWGDGMAGQLGNGTTSPSLGAVEVSL